jgi:hypothetical protein
MAAATSKLVVNAFPYGVTNDQSQQILYGTIQLSSGGTYVTNGVPISWQFFNPDGTVFTPAFGPQTTDPITVYFTSLIGGVQTATPALQSYLYDSVHNTLRIYNGSLEVLNNAAIAVDTIGFEVHYARGV